MRQEGLGKTQGQSRGSNVLIPNPLYPKKKNNNPDQYEVPIPMAQGSQPQFLGKSSNQESFAGALKFSNGARQADAEMTARHAKGFKSTTGGQDDFLGTWTLLGFLLFAISFVVTALCTQKQFFQLADWFAGIETWGKSDSDSSEKQQPLLLEDNYNQRAETAWLHGKSFYSQQGGRRPIRKEPQLKKTQLSHQYMMQNPARLYQPTATNNNNNNNKKQSLLTTRTYDLEPLYETDHTSSASSSSTTLASSLLLQQQDSSSHDNTSSHSSFTIQIPTGNKKPRQMSMTSTMSGHEYYHPE